jgi:DNA-binding GntR family transcriptional regulator
MVTRLDRPSLTDLAYQALVEAIYDRTFAPGASVSIDGLAAALGTSVTPVREALVRAASLRLLTRESNKGFRVAPLLTSAEYHYLFEIRRLTELCALANARLTEPGIARLAEQLKRMKTTGDGPSYRDYAAFSAADRDFHVALVEMSDNAFAVDAWSNLHHHLHVSRLYAGRGVVDAREAVHEHGAIVAAARTGDRAALIEATRTHIVLAEQRIARLHPDAVAIDA